MSIMWHTLVLIRPILFSDGRILHSENMKYTYTAFYSHICNFIDHLHKYLMERISCIDGA